MGVIRCPKCKLINRGNARRCRRCATPLSSGNPGDIHDSKSMNFNRAVLHWAIPVIVIVSLLCIYSYYRHSKGVSNPGIGLDETNKVIVRSAPANQELEGVKELSRDFMAELDRNAVDFKGDGLSKNRALAYNMLMLLKDQQSRLSDPAAQKYLDEFYRLVGKYYDQMVQLNSETAHLAEVRQRITNEIEHVKKDPTLPSEDKISKEADLRVEVLNEFQERNIIANDIDETVTSLRILSSSNAAL